MKRGILACLLAALPIALPLFAQAPAPSPMKPTQWPKLDERKLDNGMTVVLVALPNVPKVTAKLVFLAGRATDAKLHAGIAQLTARVLTEGTETRTSKQLKDELRNIGGDIGTATDADSTSVNGNSLSEFAPKLFELMADVVRRPSFPAAEVELARNNFLQEIEEQQASPEFLVSEQLFKSVFGSDPYGFTIGDAAAIKKMTRDQLKAFAAKWYSPNNAYLIVLGDFDKESAAGAIEKSFGSWKKVELPKAEYPPLPKRDKRAVIFVDRPGSVQSTIIIGNSGPPRKSPDYIPLREASNIFGGSFYSRLTRNIREAKGYTYSPSGGAFTRRRAGDFTAIAAVRNEVTGATILEMLYEIDRMRVLPVTDEELQNDKAFAGGNLALEVESQGGFSNRIETIYKFGLQKDFLQTFGTKLNALTAADIERAAAKYFDTVHGALVVVGDYSKVKDQVAPFGDIKLVQPK